MFTCSIQARGQFQRFVLRAAELDDLIDALYGFDNSGDIKPAKDWLLIDDTPADNSGTVEKLKQLSGQCQAALAASKWDEIVVRHYKPCTKFQGKDDEHPLTELTYQVLKRLGCS